MARRIDYCYRSLKLARKDCPVDQLSIGESVVLDRGRPQVIQVKMIFRKLNPWLAWPKDSIASNEQVSSLVVNADDIKKDSRGVETPIASETCHRNDVLKWGLNVLTPVSDTEED